MMKTQKWMLLASVILFLGAVALVAFSILTPYAWAQGPGTGMDWGQGMMADGDFGPRFGMGPGGGRGQMMGPGGPENSLISIAAEKLGLTNDELIAELQAGKTIADVAAEKNVALNTIVDAVVAAHTERLNEQVANGQLTQEQADAMLVLMKANVTERLNGQGPAQGRGFGFGGRGDHAGMGMMGGQRGGPENSLVTVVAEELGLTPAELATELRAGKSVADVAQEKNVSVGTIAEAVLAPRTERLNELVAAGQLTQEEVDNYLSNRRVEVIERLNQSRASQNPTPGAAPNESESN
jgi:hypothetical protein